MGINLSVAVSKSITMLILQNIIVKDYKNRVKNNKNMLPKFILKPVQINISQGFNYLRILQLRERQIRFLKI